MNLSQSVGISYYLKSNVLGSLNEPNTALFNLSQIASLVTYGKPVFGVYDSTNSFATIEFVNSGSQIEFRFSPGIVFYKRNLINIPSQSIPVASSTDNTGQKLYKFYLDYNDFSLASTVFRATITAVNANAITVDQLPNVNYLSNYTSANINNYLFSVTSIDAGEKTIVLSQDVSSYASVDSTITLIFQPTIKYILTSAISGSPPDLDIPSSGIILASALVDVSGAAPFTYACPPNQIEKLFEAYPIYTDPATMFPNRAAYNAFLINVNNALKTYNTVQNYEIESKIVNSFITYTSSISSNISNFDQYWHLQPYTPTNLFQYGTVYQGLQKTDFDPRFKDFYYHYKNIDLTRSLAIFRGDIFGGNAYVGQALGQTPGSSTSLNLVDFTSKSTILNGTYSYGVSAVVADGEYSPQYSSNANHYANKKVNNYISWTAPTAVSDLLFFHVYRNKRDASGYQQERITAPFELTEYTLNDAVLNSTTGTTNIGTSHFAFKIKDSTASEGLIGGLGFRAYIEDNTPLTGIQSCIIQSAGANYINPYAVINGTGSGAAISLTTSAGGVISTATVTAFGSGYTTEPTITIFDAASASGGAGAAIVPILSQLNCGITTGNATGPIGTSVIDLYSIPIASISSAYYMNMPLGGAMHYGLASNTYYWARFSMNIPYSLVSSQYLKFKNSSGFIGSVSTSYTGSSWIVSSTSSQIAKLGVVDNGLDGDIASSRGVYLTNDQAAYPCRLQIFVPNLDLSSLSYANIGPAALTNETNAIISSAPIQNSMFVYVVAENTVLGIQSTLVGSLPKDTNRGSAITLGGENDLFDKVLDVFVVPDIASGVNYIGNTKVINWTIYDTFSIDTVP